MSYTTTSSLEPHLYAGAGSGGLFRKSPGMDRWEQLEGSLPDQVEVRVLTVHPIHPEIVYAGTDSGLYKSRDHGENWSNLNIPAANSVVWSLLFQPQDPDTIYVGMAPAQIFRSEDRGETWQLLPLVLGPDVCRLAFDTRVISMAANPVTPLELYAALEVGGMVRSLDGGDSWEPINSGLADGGEDRLDLHGVQVSSAQPDTPYISTREGIFRGFEKGERWEPIDLSKFSSITYTRCLLLMPNDPNTLVVSLGRAARSEEGALLRSRDLGYTWERVDHGVSPDSTMMTIATNPRSPSQVYCGTRGGQVFGSLDEGASWTEYPLPEGVADVYALAIG